MKVLQVLPSLTAGGAEGFITNLGVSLGELGVDVRFYLLGGARGERGHVLHERLQRAGIAVTGVGERYPGSPGNLFELASLLRSYRPDVVQANLYTAEVACAAARLLAPGRRMCFVRRLVNTDLVEYRSAAVVRALDRFYPQVVACSDAVADAYRTFMGDRQRARLTTIPNGGLLQGAPADDAARYRAREKLGVAPDAFVVAHIGRYFSGGGAKQGGLNTGQKAQDVLLAAFAKTFKGRPYHVLLLAGDGPLRPEAESSARNLGIGDQVRFLGQQPEPWDTLNAADVFCFPSRYEGLPNVLPEAASVGLPVVGSDIPEIRDLSPGDAWLLAPVNDVDAFSAALRAVSDDLNGFKSRARAAAGAFRERFSMEACAAHYLRVYESAVGSPQPEIPPAGKAG